MSVPAETQVGGNNGNGIHAVPVDVVDSSLGFQAAGVNPKKDKRTPLLVVDHLEGQSTQVVLVPTPGEKKHNEGLLTCQ